MGLAPVQGDPGLIGLAEAEGSKAGELPTQQGIACEGTLFIRRSGD